MKKNLINKVKEIETIIELNVDGNLTEELVADLYFHTNDLMLEIKKLDIPNDGKGKFYTYEDLDKFKDECYQEALQDLKNKV